MVLKLHHLVDDKIHARSTGPYSLVTQQPLGGKAQFGVKDLEKWKFGHWKHMGRLIHCKKILTVKLMMLTAGLKTYEAIVKGENVPELGNP